MISLIQDISLIALRPTRRYMQLLSVVPTDPAVLSKLGEIYDNDQDKSQAFQYHYEVKQEARDELQLLCKWKYW